MTCSRSMQTQKRAWVHKKIYREFKSSLFAVKKKTWVKKKKNGEGVKNRLHDEGVYIITNEGESPHQEERKERKGEGLIIYEGK